MADPTTNYTRTTEQSLPSYLAPYAQNLLEKGAAAGQAALTPNPLQQQALQGIGGLQAYKPNTSSFADQGIAGQYMNPYIQNVLDINKQEAARSAAIQGQGEAAQAVGRGAFGGYRHGLVEAENERNLGILQNRIQAEGMNNAFNAGQQQFNAERQQNLQEGLLGYQTGIGALGKQWEMGTAQQNIPMNAYKYMQGLMIGMPMQSITETQNYAPPNPLAQLAGLATTGMGVYDKYKQLNKQPNPDANTPTTGNLSVPSSSGQTGNSSYTNPSMAGDGAPSFSNPGGYFNSGVASLGNSSSSGANLDYGDLNYAGSE